MIISDCEVQEDRAMKTFTYTYLHIKDEFLHFPKDSIAFNLVQAIEKGDGKLILELKNDLIEEQLNQLDAYVAKHPLRA